MCLGGPGMLLTPTLQGQPNRAQQPQLGGKAGAASPPSLIQGDIMFKGGGRQNPHIATCGTPTLPPGVWERGPAG